MSKREKAIKRFLDEAVKHSFLAEGASVRGKKLFLPKWMKREAEILATISQNPGTPRVSKKVYAQLPELEAGILGKADPASRLFGDRRLRALVTQLTHLYLVSVLKMDLAHDFDYREGMDEKARVRVDLNRYTRLLVLVLIAVSLVPVLSIPGEEIRKFLKDAGIDEHVPHAKLKSALARADFVDALKKRLLPEVQKRDLMGSLRRS